MASPRQPPPGKLVPRSDSTGPPLENPLVPLLRSVSARRAPAVAVVAPPQAVELAEVHVGPDPARLVGLRRLAAQLAEEAAVPRAGAGALGLGVGGLERGRGALAAGRRGRAEGGRGDRRLVGDGYQRGDGPARGDGTGGGGEAAPDVGEGGGERQEAGRRRGGGKRREGSGERETREGKEEVEVEGGFGYGAEHLHTGWVEAEGRTRGDRTDGGHQQVGEEKQARSDGEQQPDGQKSCWGGRGRTSAEDESRQRSFFISYSTESPRTKARRNLIRIRDAPYGF